MPDNNTNTSVQQQLDELRKRAMSEIHSNRKKLDGIVPPQAEAEEPVPDPGEKKEGTQKKKEKKSKSEASVLVKKEDAPAEETKKDEKPQKPEKKKKPEAEEPKAPEIVPVKNGVSVLTRHTEEQEADPLEEKKAAPVQAKAEAEPKPEPAEQKAEPEIIDDGFEDDLDELFGPKDPPAPEKDPSVKEAPVPEPQPKPVKPVEKEDADISELDLDEIFSPDPSEPAASTEKADESELDSIFEDEKPPQKAAVAKTEDEELDNIFDDEPKSAPAPPVQPKEKPQKKHKEKKEEKPAPAPKEPEVSKPEKKAAPARHKGPHSIRTRKVLYVDMEGRELSGFKLVDRSTGRTYELEKNNSIGRDASNDITLSSNYVSGKHAVITQKEGFFFVKDLGSKNGTLLNNNKVEKEERLAPGDKITFGDIATLFTAEAMQDNDTQQNAKAKHAEISLVRKDTGEVFEIFDNMTIGRDMSNDISIPEPDGHYVSARHAVLTLEGKNVRLKDMDSSNGTFIGNNKIKSKTIYKGNLIKIADIEFEVV